VHDHRLPGGCPTCGGDLTVRIGASGARGYCPACARISTVLMVPAPGGAHFVHLAFAA
jgi:hypothetical protein